MTVSERIVRGQVWRRKRDGKLVRVTAQPANGYVRLWWPGVKHGFMPAIGRHTLKDADAFLQEFEPATTDTDPTEEMNHE